MNRTIAWSIAGGFVIGLVILGFSRPMMSRGEQSPPTKFSLGKEAVEIGTSPPNRPIVPGDLDIHPRKQQAVVPNRWTTIETNERWKASETAIIVCDMWDDIYCQSAAQRIKVLVPKMNEVLTNARNRGVMIIHCPSGTMHMVAGTPYRDRMKLAPLSQPSVKIESWCEVDPKKEPALPVDVSKSPCDDPVVGPVVQRYSRQHLGLDICGYDGVTESGAEVYNFCKANGIKNLAIMGVHTNMCVLGRSFGIRQMTRLGMNVVLVRDMTDAMYDPRERPFVSHARGTEMIVEHIERHWCPSIVSPDLTKFIVGSAGPISQLPQ